MAKDNLRDYDATAANNTDVGGVNTAEGMLPSKVNDAIREIMSHLADFSDGSEGIDVLSLSDDDDSAQIKFQAPSAVTATVTFTLPDGDGSADQILKTNGSGTLAWVDQPSGGGLFKGENGEVGSSAGDIFRCHEQTLNTDVTIDSDENALCASPITIATGVTLTVNGNLSIV